MKYEKNTVAKIFKIYAILNAVACFIFMYVLIAADYLDTLGVIIWLAVSTVINLLKSQALIKKSYRQKKSIAKQRRQNGTLGRLK